jgi:tetratricopeptide (TPR) repeat protein
MSFGHRHDCLLYMRLILAEAYEANMRWPEADRECTEVKEWYDDHLINPHQDDANRIWQCLLGYSRCMVQLGNYYEALSSAQQAVQMWRESKGVHKLLAKAQRASARPPTLTPWTKRRQTNKVICTMMDAVDLIYHSMMYEVP